MFRLIRTQKTRALTASAFPRSLATLSSRERLRTSRIPSPESSSFRSWLPQHPRRWQSTGTEQTSTGSASPSEDGEPGTIEGEDPTKKELENKDREIIDLKDKYLRSVADFRNLQERSKRDVESARLFAIQRFAGDLVESIDNLDRALETVPQESLAPDVDSDPESAPNKDLVNLYTGLKMTESILMGTLKKHGLERFDPAEEKRKFDPRLDEATFMTKVEGREDGDAFMTQSKGFTLNGRVLRAAKVGVVKND